MGKTQKTLPNLKLGAMQTSRLILKFKGFLVKLKVENQH